MSETGGGYKDVYEWTSADWRTIKIKTYSGSVDCFMLAECKEQFPVKTSFTEDFTTGSLGWFLEYLHTKEESHEDPGSRVIDANLIAKVIENEHLVLWKQFSNGKWQEFPSTMKLANPFSEISFNQRRQLLAYINDNLLLADAIRFGEIESSWECPVEPGSKIAWSSSGNTLAVASPGRVSLLHWGGVLVLEGAIKAERVLSCQWNSQDTELLVGTPEGIHVIPFARPIASALPSQNRFTRSQLLLFRQDHLLKAGETKSSWDLVSVPMDYLRLQERPVLKQCVEGSDWIALSCDLGMVLFDKTKRSLDIVALDLCILQMAWLNDLLIVLCRATSRHEVTSLKVMTPSGQIKQSITLLKACISFNITSSGHVMVMFEDMTVHLYRVIAPKAGQVLLQFDLNLSLSLFTGSHPRAQSPFARWCIDLFERQTIASPSEVDLCSATVGKVLIEHLLFLQGDALFSVLLRNTNLTDAASSAVIEPSGVLGFFLLPSHFGDSWLLTLHEDCLRCRKWPFSPDRSVVDIEIGLKFFPMAFYPDSLGGLFVGAKAVTSDRQWTVQHSEILPLLPYFAKHYMSNGDLSTAKHLFDSVVSPDLKSIMLEYLLVDIIEVPRASMDSSNLIQLIHKNASQLMGTKQLYLKALVRAARKIDVGDAAWLFHQISSPEVIFNDCLAGGDVDTAAMFLMLRLVLPRTETNDTDDAISTDDDRIPVVNLISMAMTEGHYRLVFDLRAFIVSIWEDPKDIELIDSAIKLAAKELVKYHRWTAFLCLSSYWAQVKDTALFDVCFGKMKVDDLKAMLMEIGWEGIVCAIFGQLEMPLPSSSALKKTRRDSQQATFSLSTASSIAIPTGTTQRPAIRDNPSYREVLDFFDANEDLRWLSAVWRACVEGDTSRITELKEADYACYVAYRDCLATSNWYILSFYLLIRTQFV